MQAVIEETRVTLTVAPLWLVYALAALCALGAVISLRKAQPVAIAIVVPIALVVAAAVFSHTFGWLNLLMTPNGRAFAWSFRPVFLAVAALSTGSSLALVCSIGALLAALRRSELSSRIPAALALIVASTCAVFAVWMVRVIGAPNGVVPRLGVEGVTRGQRAISHVVRVRFEWPATRNWLFTTAPRAMTEQEIATMHARCDECSRTVTTDATGPVQLSFRASLRGYTLERTVSFVVEDDRGDPRLPLQVGARWTFRDRLDRTTRAGGWAVAMADGLRSLTPRDVVHRRLGDQRAELRVERSFVADGVRLWSLVFERGARRSTVTVFTMDGQTWVTRDLEHPRAAREPWFRESPTGMRAFAGLVPCVSAFVPFSMCGDGTSPRVPAGPAWGAIGDQSGMGLFVAAITVGAVVPGAGSSTSWCLDAFTEGSGERASVSAVPARATEGDPREAESLALCAAPAFERERPASVPPPTRAVRARNTRARSERPVSDHGIVNPF